MKDLYQVIVGPVMTEKSNVINEKEGKVVFKVARDANKIEIKQAVENLFDVKVGSVRTVNVQGKKRRVGAKSVGKASDWKKAYITLTEGQINLLDEL